MKMYKVKQPILRLPENVKKDTLAYRGQVEKFLQGQISPIAFRAYRVPMGVYEQREPSKYMVRIRIGAGLVLPYQLERIAQLSKAYGNGFLHITTRQDIQIHEVNIEDTVDIIEGLLEVGLSPRGGGGNTVRNITACSRAGVCPKEEFDVTPYAIAAAEYLLQFKSSYNLPRKFKIVFSGCSVDCAFASVADLGFFAHQKNGARGFAVYAGGGQGSNPSVAVKIEDFINDNEFLEVTEAVKRLFDKHGDRANKHKARLRYVLARLGEEEFVSLYRSERAEIAKQGLEGSIPNLAICVDQLEDHEPPTDKDLASRSSKPDFLPEKKKGFYTVRLNLPLGDIPATDLIKIGQIAENYAAGIVRTTQRQNLLILSVAKTSLSAVTSELMKLSINVFTNGMPKVVACAGASTCKLGLCLSRGLAKAISDKLTRQILAAGTSEKSINISGCPNSCGHHYVADVGLQGRAKRANGKLMPCYDVLAGARIVEGDARLAERIGTVPAKKMPDLLVEVFKNGAFEKQPMNNLVQRYGDFSSVQLPDDFYYDYGSSEPFSLAGRGPGECGAGVMDVIKFDIEEAKEAVKLAYKAQAAKDKSESVYKATIAAARALLVTFGLEPKKDREVFAAFRQHLIEPGWVEAQTQQLINDAIDWRMGDKASIDDLAPQADGLTKRVEELFLSLDANLKFKAKPVIQRIDAEEIRTKNHHIDLRGIECPLNFVKAKLELEKIDFGQILEILLDEGEPIRNVPESFTEQGQEVVEVKNLGNHFCVKVRRKK